MIPTNLQIHGVETARQAWLANVGPRAWRLNELERWVDGTQYQGRPNWFAPVPEVPLWEREPCVVYPVVQIAISSNVDLCLGEGKFPAFGVAHSGSAKATEATEEQDPIESYLQHAHKLSRFPTVVKAAYRDGQGCGTAVGILGARNGLPTEDLVPAKWCEREVDAAGNVTKLTIEYPYLDEYRQPDGSWAVRTLLYRRVIDEQRDVTFLPAVANENGIKPTWEEDPAKTVKHGLGFCPVVWYAFMRGCQPVNVIDGRAIHTQITDEIQAHDIARSQWHRGALYSEPQICEIGVPAGYNPTGEGRAPVVPSTEVDSVTGETKISGGFREDDGIKGARKKGPGEVWQYPSKDTKPIVLAYPAEALKAQQDNCSDLRIKIQEALCVVFLDVENIKTVASGLSGKALEALRKKQLDRVDEHRDDLEAGFIVPSIVMQLRILRKLGAGMKVPGAAEALKALGSREFSTPDIQVTWGEYFKPDPEEQSKLIALVKEALKDNPLITKKIAVEKIAAIFGIKDVQALLDELEKEAKERVEKMATEVRLLRADADPGRPVQGNPGGLPPGGNRGRPQDGQVDAGQAGD